MKKRIFRSCTILVLGLAATRPVVSAQEGDETPSIEGVWFSTVTPVDCQTGAVIPNVSTFRALNMFSHDGSLTTEAAFLMPTPRRSSGLGAWRHAQGHTYTATFRFFRYDPNNLFLVMRKVTFTILLNGDQFTSVDMSQDFDANNNPLPTVSCATEIATRVQ